jgi:hypothetical protein
MPTHIRVTNLLPRGEPSGSSGRRLGVRALPIVVAAALAIACAPRDRHIRLERLDAERRNLEATFDRLEDRLTASQARVRFWQEMRSRHESVSAIACASLDQHADDMARAPDAPHSSLHRSRVAAATPGSTRPSVRVPAVRD